MSPLHRASCALVLVLAAACGGGNAASQLVKTPDYAPKGQSKCGVEKSQAKPLIVEWPSPDRLELENKVSRGLVVVHYVGCEMSVLDRCSVPAKYNYQGATRNQDKVEMKDEDDLYAHLPVGAAGLEATLQRTGQLTVDMDLVGRFEAERASVRADELQGDCAGATHFVYGVTVGAFDFYAGGQASVGAGVGVGSIGAGGHSQAERESLTKAGDQAACAKATTADKAPPDNCGALIRLEVVPLAASGAVTAAVANAPTVGAPVTPAPPPPPQIMAPAGSCPAGMASLPGGTFTMGERKDSVTVQPFCLDVTEVTVQAYGACAKTGQCAPAPTSVDWPNITDAERTKWSASCNAARTDRSNHPINCIEWGQAATYCQAQGKRLPTEEEWEWAARGGVEGRAYPWGSALPDMQLCWAGITKRTVTCPVDSFPKGDSPAGIHDLAGNVWEWTSNADGANARVYRGGCSFYDDPAKMRADARFRHGPTFHDTGSGFRCAR